MAPIPGSGAANGCEDVALLAFLNRVSCLEPVVHFSDLIQGLVNIQTCGCRQRCLPFLGTVLTLLPAEWALYPGSSVVPFSEQLDPRRLWLQLQYIIPI
jgi:hypothetical protein